MALGFTSKAAHGKAGSKPFFRAAVRNASTGGAGVLEMMVYEQIGENWWTGEGITAKNVKQTVDRMNGAFSRVMLRINSPGGDAFEGVAILNLLRSLGKPIDVCVDGIAASAASIIAMAGDTITMGSGAMMMIHNAWSMVAGNAAALTKEAETLAAIDTSIAQTYVDRTGQELSAVKAMMDAETWMGADECIEKGFATGKSAPNRAEDSERALNMARGFKALTRFTRVPSALKPVAAEQAAATACECDCQNCRDGECENCSAADCQDENCENCPMQAERAAATDRRQSSERQIINQLVARLDLVPGADHHIVADAHVEVLAVRRSLATITVLNLAPAADGSAAVARVAGIVAPYGSPSGDLGGFEEVYQQGCFDKFLGTDDPRVLAFHNPESVLGRKSAGTARFWSDAAGLHYEADLPDTQVARDLRVSMERGDVRESSAAFYITDYAWENRGGVRTRVIKEARLVEASPYSFPAYPDSTAASEEAPQASADHELEHLGARLQLLKIA